MKRLMWLAAVAVLAGVGAAAWAGPFDNVDVKYWAGSGTNEAVVVVDFNLGQNYAFGYRWDGDANSWMALEAIDAAGALSKSAAHYLGLGWFLNDMGYPGAVKRGTGLSLFTSAGGTSWSSSWEGPSTRQLTSGAWDGWCFGTWGGPPDYLFSPADGPQAPWLGSKKVLLKASFAAGQTAADLGLTVQAGGDANLAALVVLDGNYAPTEVLQMSDAVGSVSVSMTVELESELRVEFDYRFLTDGKLKVLVGGATAATVLAPAGGEGRDSFAHFAQTFDLDALGVADSNGAFQLELTNAGDPAILLDNVDVTGVPEPVSLAILSLAGAGLLARRRRR